MTRKQHARSRLFQRHPDECFVTLDSLAARCAQVRAASRHLWQTPARVTVTNDLQLVVADKAAFSLTDWSFGQLCRLAQLNKQVMNRLTRRMASQIFQRTWPQTVRPWEILVAHDRVRDIWGFSYSRLWNCEVLGVLREFESHCQPPPTKDLSCGLFCGEQDLFCFLIEPNAWIEFDGATYAPGVVVSNSEVGRRPLRVQAFWYQAVEHNHFLFDPIFPRPFCPPTCWRGPRRTGPDEPGAGSASTSARGQA